MKKITFLLSGISMLILSGCGTSALGTAADVFSAVNSTTNNGAANTVNTGANVLGGILSTATSGNNLANIFTSVIGMDKVTSTELIGKWNYKEPGCAFISQSTLASAGGEVIAATVKQKLASTYNKIGVSSNNTSFVFNTDGTFIATILGKNWTGTYTFDEKTQAIKMNGLLLSLSGYTKRNAEGIALLFESKKVLTLIQTLSALSGNSTLNTIGDVSSSYDGVRIGFDLKR